MKKNIRFSALIMILVFFVAGCYPAAEAAPPAAAVNPTVIDANQISTQAAQTVIAGVTLTAMANPTSTPTPTITATIGELAQAAPVLPDAQNNAVTTYQPPQNQGLSAPTFLPSVVPSTAAESSQRDGVAHYGPTKTKTYYPDTCRLTFQSPQDWIKLKPGQDFDGRWRFLNTGARAWNKEFYFHYLGGKLEPKNTTNLMLWQNVAIADEIDLVVDYVAPLIPGNYVSQWTIMNDDGVGFCKFFVAIRVVEQP